MGEVREVNGSSSSFVVAGEVFLDVVFASLDAPMTMGTEAFAQELEIAPGGISNVAFAMSRLGNPPTLISSLGQDAFGVWIRKFLEEEGVDLSQVSKVDQTSITASVASGTDRAMVTHSPETNNKEVSIAAESAPILLDLGSQWAKGDWWRSDWNKDSVVYADVRWEGTEQWKARTLTDLENCSVFTPNTKEALFLSSEDNVEDAAKKLSEIVELVVVTGDKNGSFAFDSRNGESLWAPAVKVDAKDATGAGDVFLASFALADQSGLSVRESVNFASLCGALSVTKFSGSFGAPTIDEVVHWYEANINKRSKDSSDDSADYGFLPTFAQLLTQKKFKSIPKQQWQKGGGTND